MLAGQPPRGGLVPERPHSRRRRSDPGDPAAMTASANRRARRGSRSQGARLGASVYRGGNDGDLIEVVALERDDLVRRRRSTTRRVWSAVAGQGSGCPSDGTARDAHDELARLATSSRRMDRAPASLTTRRHRPRQRRHVRRHDGWRPSSRQPTVTAAAAQSAAIAGRSASRRRAGARPHLARSPWSTERDCRVCRIRCRPALGRRVIAELIGSWSRR